MSMDRRPLQYWLSPQLSQAGQSETTVLRVMANNYSARRATYLMMAGWGSWLLVLAVLLAGADLAPALWGSLAGIGLALGGIALLLRSHHLKNPLASYRRWVSSRAPRTVNGAVTALALFMIFMCGFILFSLFYGASHSITAGDVIGSVMAGLFMANTLLVPAWHSEHAVAIFRRHIQNSPEARSWLEDLALHGTDPKGPEKFGPL